MRHPLPDHDNHHNALKCPYCNPQKLVLVDGAFGQRFEEVLSAVDETAAMLRGMTLDPSIPEHAKEAMRGRIEFLESLVEKYAE